MGSGKERFGGIIPALCTTFAEDGSLDVAAQRDVVRFVLSCGADGVVCFGLAGEVNKLTSEERKRLSSIIIKEVGGSVPVLVGVGAEALHTAKELARYAEAEGADGVVIPPPITSHLDEDGLTPISAKLPMPSLSLWSSKTRRPILALNSLPAEFDGWRSSNPT